MTLKSDKKFEKKKQFVVLKLTKIWWILIRALKSQKNLHFDWPLRAKYITWDLKKYRGVIFHDNEVSCKIWRKTDLWFGKRHDEFGKFSPEHSKVSKSGLDGILLSKVENVYA